MNTGRNLIFEPAPLPLSFTAAVVRGRADRVNLQETRRCRSRAETGGGGEGMAGTVEGGKENACQSQRSE